MITIIVAVSNNNVIGIENNLPWKLQGDLKRFKSLTTGHPIVMGRKTFESLPKLLPQRTHIVISKSKKSFEKGVIVAENIEEGIKKALEIDENIFIIGGGSIYEQAMTIADVLEITRVDCEIKGDTFFSNIDEKIWKKVSETIVQKTEKDEFNYKFERYEKI